MSAPVALPRPRHLVLMTTSLDETVAVLEDGLGARDPFSDPIAGDFGLRNVIYAVGDTFLEVCTPVDSGSAGQRHLDRVGDCGYMVIFQVADLAESRSRIAHLGIRQVWQGAGPGIEGTHLHPGDVPGSILSLDQATPSGSWAWGGPAWTGVPEVSTTNPIAELTVEVPEPATAARTWASALGLAAPEGGTLEVAATDIRFIRGDAPRGLTGVRYVLPGVPTSTFEVSGVRFDLETAPEEQGAAR